MSSKTDVLLVVRRSALKAVADCALLSCADDAQTNGDSRLYFWSDIDWNESPGEESYRLVMALNQIEVDANDYLLLRTWGQDAVDIAGCYWDNPFKVKLHKVISFDGNTAESGPVFESSGEAPEYTPENALSLVVHLADNLFHACAGDDEWALFDLIRIIGRNNRGFAKQSFSSLPPAFQRILYLYETYYPDDIEELIWTFFPRRPEGYEPPPASEAEDTDDAEEEEEDD